MRCICVFGVRLNGMLKMRCPPRCSTLRLLTISGSRLNGGSGGPTLTHAARKTGRKRERETERRRDGAKEGRSERRTERKRDGSRFVSPSLSLQNVSTKVFILHNVGQHLAHVIGVHNLEFFFQVGAFE